LGKTFDCHLATHPRRVKWGATLSVGPFDFPARSSGTLSLGLDHADAPLYCSPGFLVRPMRGGCFALAKFDICEWSDEENQTLKRYQEKKEKKFRPLPPFPTLDDAQTKP